MRSFGFVSAIPQSNISPPHVLAQVAAQKWLRHWKAITKKWGMLLRRTWQILYPHFGLLVSLWLAGVISAPLPSCLVKKRNPPGAVLETSKREWDSERTEVNNWDERVNDGARKTDRERWRGAVDGRREQPCRVWSRKLARQQRQLYSTDTMSKRYNGSHAESGPCTTPSCTHRIKASTHFKIHPMKRRGRGYILHARHQQEKKKWTQNAIWGASFDEDILWIVWCLLALS